MSTRPGCRCLVHLIVLLTTGLAGCAEMDEGSAPGRVGDSADAVPIDAARSSTPGDIAVRNLSSQIAGRLAFLERRPDDLAIRGQVVGLLLSRAHYTGSFSDFDEATMLSEGSVLRFPDRPEPHEQRASVLGALHLFEQAGVAIERAEDLSAPAAAARFDAARAVNAIATGDPLGDVLVWATDRALAHPSYETVSTLAVVEAAMGLYEEADLHYRESLALYRDVSPFPLAFIAFQRGVMWAEMANRPELAIPLYREAVRRLPTYVVANVHLAELEATLLGDDDAAIARLRALVGSAEAPRVEDPEPLGLLGELLLAVGRAEEGAAYVIAAAAMYDGLLARHPEAFADHGSEFFAGPGGDPERAVRLSQRNLELRQNPRAFIVAIEAALAAGDDATLCETAARAERAAQTSVALQDTIAGVATRCD